MSNAFKPLDPVIDAILGEKVVAFRPQFARAFGGSTVGLLLSQFWFYSMMETAKGRDGWFYAPQDQIEEDTGMTRPEQETARRKLKELGILEEDKTGIPAKLWYHVNKERAIQQLREFLIRDAQAKAEKEIQDAVRAEARKQAAPRSTSKDAGIQHTGGQESRIHQSVKSADKRAGKPRAITKSPLRIPKNTLKAATAAPEVLASLLKSEKPNPPKEEFHPAITKGDACRSVVSDGMDRARVVAALEERAAADAPRDGAMSWRYLTDWVKNATKREIEKGVER